MFRVEELKDKKEWEDFLLDSPDGTFYHSLKWKEVIERSFHDSPVYLTVRDANGIVGICPGFILSSMHIKIYHSMPYSDYGGPVMARHSIQQSSLSLPYLLQRFFSDMGVAYLSVNTMNDTIERSFSSSLGYVDTTLGIVEIDLEATPSRFIWEEIFSRNRRKKVLRFEREGYVARQAKTKSDLGNFYKLYCEDMKYIGARSFSYEFLENMWSLLYPLNLRIWLVERESVIGGILVLKDAGTTYPFLAGIDRRGQTHARYPHGLVNYLYWKEIETAEAEGRRYVSCGSTPSDPRHPYYLQKISYGGIFKQRKVVHYPCSYVGRILLRAEAKTISSWRTIGRFLPTRLKMIMRRQLQGWGDDY